MTTFNAFPGQAKNVFSYVTAVGSTLSLGALSFCGALLLIPSWPLAALAFFLAVAIEGAVYRQNIVKAVSRLENQKLLIKCAIAKRELKKLSAMVEFKNNEFLKDYFGQVNYLHKLEEDLEHFHEEDEETAQREIDNVKMRIQVMEVLFIDSLQKKINNDSPTPNTLDATASTTITNDPVLFSINELLPQYLSNDIKQINEEIENKNKWMNRSKLTSVLSGMCAGLVSLSSMHTFIVYAGLSAATASFIAAPIVAFAALGYGLMMYRTITDMIQNETIKKWGGEIRNFFNTPKNERTASFYLKAVGIVAITALSVAATIATAGSWWYLAKAGAQLIPKLPALGASIMSGGAWAASIKTTFCFNVENAFKSAKLILRIIKNKIANIKKDWKEARKSENWKQMINPFRFVLKIFTGSIAVGHFASIAVTAEQNRIFSRPVTTAVTMAQEPMTDLPCIVGHAHGYDHEHDNCSPPHQITSDTGKMPQNTNKSGHSHDPSSACNNDACANASDHHNHNGSAHINQTQFSSVPITAASLLGGSLSDLLNDVSDDNRSPTYDDNHDNPHTERLLPEKHECCSHKDHEHHNCHDHEEHDHQHGDLVLNKIESGIAYLAAGWDWLFSKSTWEESKRKFFPQKKLPDAPNLSLSWVKYETSQRVEHYQQVYENAGPSRTNKAAAFAELKQEIKTISDAEDKDKNKLPTVFTENSSKTNVLSTSAGPSDEKYSAGIAEAQITPEAVSSEASTDVAFKKKLKLKIEALTTTNNPLGQHCDNYGRFFSKNPKSKQILDAMLNDRSLGIGRCSNEKLAITARVG